jgi:hypothetical protein
MKNEEWKMKNEKVIKLIKLIKFFKFIKFIKLIYLREYYLILNWRIRSKIGIILLLRKSREI